MSSQHFLSEISRAELAKRQDASERAFLLHLEGMFPLRSVDASQTETLLCLKFQPMSTGTMYRRVRNELRRCHGMFGE